jgi:hypothetical protein
MHGNRIVDHRGAGLALAVTNLSDPRIAEQPESPAVAEVNRAGAVGTGPTVRAVED